jgi:hypothetical protein
MSLYQSFRLSSFFLIWNSSIIGNMEVWNEKTFYSFCVAGLFAFFDWGYKILDAKYDTALGETCGTQ